MLLSFLCCCGVPGYYLQPMWTQYPATASLPARVADLQLRDDPAGEQIAKRLELSVQADHLLADEHFAGVYGAPGGKSVIIFGVTGFRVDPEDDVTAEMARLTKRYQLREVRPMTTGSRGIYQQCGVGRAEGTDVVVCTWADHGSLATGLFTLRSVEESSTLLTELRNTIITRG